MRPDYMGFMFFASAMVSFNAGIWQLYRRGEKKSLLERHKNILKPPVHELPPGDSSVTQFEFTPAELDGTFDNEGSVLVGPRSIPSYKGAASTDESRGGFLVMTPFEVAHTKQFIMVNRGWVPIDAGKHRTLLMQYIGEGFAPATVRGLFRREEFVSESLLWGGGKKNEGPVAADLSWLSLRPWNMMVEYYKRRWGEKMVRESVDTHGAHHYFLEMVEDYSGDDQRTVRGRVWPRRRDLDEVTYVHLTPIVHTMYVVFWFSVTAGSLYGMGKCYMRQMQLITMRKRMTAQATQFERKRQEEAKAYAAAMLEVERRKSLGSAAATASGTAARLDTSDSNEKNDKR